MHRIVRLVALVLSLCLGEGAAVAEDAKKLTNADVISMVKAGLSEDTVVAAIRGKPSAFDTSPQALIDLKKKGVSDAVLQAMAQAGAPTSPATKSEEPVQPYAVLASGGSRRTLPSALAQVAQLKGKHDDFTSMGKDTEVQMIGLGAAAGLAGNVGASLGAGALGGAAGMGIIGGAMAGLSALHKPKYTFLLAIPGAQSKNVVAESSQTIELFYADIAGVDPDAYEAIVVRLVPNKNNTRIIRAQTVKQKGGRFEPDGKVTQDQVQAAVDKPERGHAVVHLEGLTPGEYAVVLRNVDPKESIAPNPYMVRAGLASVPQGAGLQYAASTLQQTVWDFSYRASAASPLTPEEKP